MSTVYNSYAVDTSGVKHNVDLINGKSYIAGTNIPVTSKEGWTVNTAGGIYKVEGGSGVLVANHNMIPIADKSVTPITSVENKQQVPTVIQPIAGGGFVGGIPMDKVPIGLGGGFVGGVTLPTTGTTATATPINPAPPVTNQTATQATANALPDIVYLSDGTMQQNTVASLGIDNSTLITGGLILGIVLLLKKFMG